MRAIDTNVLVRLITRDNSSQTISAEAFISSGAWVSLLALTEAAWVLGTVYERKSADLANAIELILRHNRLTVQDSDVVAAALEVFRARPSLGFSDCLMLQIAAKAGHLPLGTFDKTLAKIAGAQKI